MGIERERLLKRQRVNSDMERAIDGIVSMNNPEDQVRAGFRLIGYLKQNGEGWMAPGCVKWLAMQAASVSGWTKRDMARAISSGRRAARLDNARRLALGDK